MLKIICRIKFQKVLIMVSTQSNEPDGGLFVAEKLSASVDQVRHIIFKCFYCCSNSYALVLRLHHLRRFFGVHRRLEVDHFFPMLWSYNQHACFQDEYISLREKVSFFFSSLNEVLTTLFPKVFHQ